MTIRNPLNDDQHLLVQDAVKELNEIKPRHAEMDALLSETASKLESVAAERSRLQASCHHNLPILPPP